MEERRVVPFAPQYTVSNLGIVRKGEKVIKGHPRKHGHIQVSLRHEGKRFTPLVHKLVLGVFNREREKDEVCRHLDGNPANNRLDNLAWGTDQENTEDKIQHGRLVFGEKSVLSKLTEVMVLEARRRAANGESTAVLAEEYGISLGAMRSVICGRKWKHLPGAFKRKPGPKKNWKRNPIGDGAGLENRVRC